MKNHKSLFTQFAMAAAIVIFLGQTAFAQGQKASPAASAEGTIDGVSVSINYFSPGVKGRKIFGGLEAWDKVWRAGANNATTFEVSQDVKVNGNALPKGKYAFFIIPKESGDWTLIFNKVWDQWGAYDYTSDEDALRVNVTPAKADMTERLNYTVNSDGTVSMSWAETKIAFTVSK